MREKRILGLMSYGWAKTTFRLLVLKCIGANCEYLSNKLIMKVRVFIRKNGSLDFLILLSAHVIQPNLSL